MAALRGQARALLTGAVRGLVCSPWFAVAAGCVIAAGAFFYSPHALLAPPSPAISVQHCSGGTCKSTIPRAVAALPASGGKSEAGSSTQANQATKAKQAAQPKQSAQSNSASQVVPPPAVLPYQVHVWSQRESYEAVITITSQVAGTGPWQLSFTMPGGQIGFVGDTAGAPPHLVGTDSVQVSGQGPDRVAVFGQGDQVTPAECKFNGQACSFSLSSPPVR